MPLEGKSLDQPDETRTFDRGRAEIVRLGDRTVGRFTFEPGWQWSESVKPIAKTDSCQVHHVGYVVSGRLAVRTDDGMESEVGPGDAYDVQPGHDGWVVGDEQVVMVEFGDAEAYAKRG